MALIKLGELITALSGKIGGQSISNRAQTTTIRNIQYTNKVGTARQKSARKILATLANKWQFLTQAQRAGFIATSINYVYTNRVEPIITRNCYQTFMFLNGNLLVLKRAINLNAPPYVPVTIPVVEYSEASTGYLIVNVQYATDVYEYAIFANPWLTFGQKPQFGLMRLVGIATAAQLKSGYNIMPMIQSFYKTLLYPVHVGFYVDPINKTTGNRLLDPELIDVVVEPVVPNRIQFYTTSKSAAWTPTGFVKTGATMHWEVTGDASGSYDINKPTINLSNNTGTAIITGTSTDNLANITSVLVNTLSITKFVIDQLDFPGNFYAHTNPAGSLFMPNLTRIVNLRIFGMQLTVLNVSNMPLLKELWAHTNQITDFSLDNNPLLDYIYIGNNPIRTLDIRMNPLITIISAQTCQIDTFLFTDVSKVIDLKINNNKLTSLSIAGMPLLKTAYLMGNPFPPAVTDSFYIQLNNFGLTNGVLRTLANRTAASDAARTSLIAKGWVITVY